MPPRKSDGNKSATGDDSVALEDKDGVSIDDLLLPKSMVQRLAKGILPPGTVIQKDALLAINKSATVFVNYLGAHANENAQRNGKKSIMPKDVLDAIEEIEFDNFLPRLEAELEKYHAIQIRKRDQYKKKKDDAQSGSTKNGAETTALDEQANGHARHSDDEGENSPPAAKKARRDPSGVDGKPISEQPGQSGDEDTVDEEEEEVEAEDEEEAEEQEEEAMEIEDELELRRDRSQEMSAEEDQSDGLDGEGSD